MLNFKDIIICDDHPICVHGVKFFLHQILGSSIEIREAHDGKNMTVLFRNRRPDLLFVDLNLPDLSGFDLIKQVSEGDNSIPIIVVTSRDDSRILLQVKAQGVKAILSKSHTVETLREALCHIPEKSEPYLDPEIIKILSKPNSDGLTKREWEVLELISRGFTNEAISKELGCSLETVKTHRANLGQKTSSRNRAELTAWYLQRKN